MDSFGNFSFGKYKKTKNFPEREIKKPPDWEV